MGIEFCQNFSAWMQWRSCAMKLTELCQKILPLVISVVLGNHIPGWCLSFLSVKWGCEATLICTNVLKACVLKDGGFPSGSGVESPPTIQETQKTRVRCLGWEDPCRRKLADFLPGNPVDRGAWCTTVHGVTKSWIRLSTWWIDTLKDINSQTGF